MDKKAGKMSRNERIALTLDFINKQLKKEDAIFIRRIKGAHWVTDRKILFKGSLERMPEGYKVEADYIPSIQALLEKVVPVNKAQKLEFYGHPFLVEIPSRTRKREFAYLFEGKFKGKKGKYAIKEKYIDFIEKMFGSKLTYYISQKQDGQLDIFCGKKHIASVMEIDFAFRS